MTFSRLTAVAAETVAAAQRELPADVRDAASAVPVHCEAAPHPGLREEGIEPDVLGLFTGPSHGTEAAYSHPEPPQIVLYINNLWDYSEESISVFRDEVRLTYLHELGHYLGWDEKQLAARGLD